MKTFKDWLSFFNQLRRGYNHHRSTQDDKDLFNKKDSEKKNYYLTKSSNGLPLWVIEPPNLIKSKEDPKSKSKSNRRK